MFEIAAGCYSCFLMLFYAPLTSLRIAANTPPNDPLSFFLDRTTNGLSYLATRVYAAEGHRLVKYSGTIRVLFYLKVMVYLHCFALLLERFRDDSDILLLLNCSLFYRMRTPRVRIHRIHKFSVRCTFRKFNVAQRCLSLR